LTVKELKDKLLNFPDDAIVYIESDHGQQSEQAGIIFATDEVFEDEVPYYGEDICWEDDWEMIKDNFNIVTAILIK
jgi:hypothetical protein